MLDTNNLPLGYVGGDIMTHGSQLARQEECDKMDTAKLQVQYYSPAQNKSINDKSNMTEEENNVLAEKITDADIDRLWNSDFAVMCPEQHAIGTMCEMGCLYGWKYMSKKLLEINNKHFPVNLCDVSKEQLFIAYVELVNEIYRLNSKHVLAHYSDIRTNHLNEKDWRRSFGINQLLYGMILYATDDNKLHENFDSALEVLKSYYGENVNE